MTTSHSNQIYFTFEVNLSQEYLVPIPFSYVMFKN